MDKANLLVGGIFAISHYLLTLTVMFICRHRIFCSHLGTNRKTARSSCQVASLFKNSPDKIWPIFNSVRCFFFLCLISTGDYKWHRQNQFSKINGDINNRIINCHVSTLFSIIIVWFIIIREFIGVYSIRQRSVVMSIACSFIYFNKIENGNLICFDSIATLF